MTRIGLIDSLVDLMTVDITNREEGYTVYVSEVCGDVDTVATVEDPPQVYNENVFVLPVTEDLVLAAASRPTKHARRFYEVFGAEFDFLFFTTSRYLSEFQHISLVNLSRASAGSSIFDTPSYTWGGWALKGLTATGRTFLRQPSRCTIAPVDDSGLKWGRNADATLAIR